MDEPEEPTDPVTISWDAIEGFGRYEVRRGGFLYIKGHKPIEIHDVQITLKDGPNTRPIAPPSLLLTPPRSLRFSFRGGLTSYGRLLLKRLVHVFRVQRHLDN